LSKLACPYPWQEQQWSHLLSRREQGNLPHAILLIGPKGLGKFKFAKAFAELYLCPEQGCGQCHSCRLFAAETHPDFYLLHAETGAIKVDDIRDLESWLTKSSFARQGKIVLINPAQAMNKSAANALLKNLEEPCEKTVLILISDMPSLLPVTIRSRCQTVIFSTEGYKYDKVSFLKQKNSSVDPELLLSLTDYAPLASLELLESDQLLQRQLLLSSLFQIVMQEQDPIVLAANCNKIALINTLTWMTTYVIDIIRAKFSIQDSYWINQDYVQEIIAIAAIVQQNTAVYKMLDCLYQLRQQSLQGINFNQQLLLESLFYQFGSTFHGKF
jgi:DNA polymerase-3 subunit delta'